ncbi:cysteine-rich CWC family protein [Aquabacterium sp.]|uniref:cysteine-rich CWC family protein n=1 Tax=Aquabacterium sp. TaxID=1872578 RepID=UPI002489601A|nr:cysteine-rich CWC family protein [Aquabacterium sp.]MDI1258847.1 cysteine-rich CWC family protein [Aquabacterium sp.]
MTSFTTECPLCGGLNACAMAAGRDVEAPCWCRAAVLSAELLAQVPEGQRGKVCICARCASFAGTPSAALGESPDAQCFPTGLSTPSVDN